MFYSIWIEDRCSQRRAHTMPFNTHLSDFVLYIALLCRVCAHSYALPGSFSVPLYLCLCHWFCVCCCCCFCLVFCSCHCYLLMVLCSCSFSHVCSLTRSLVRPSSWCVIFLPCDSVEISRDKKTTTT